MARICLIRGWYYPVDERINREVDALLRDGHEVDIICARMPGQRAVEHVGRVTVHRLPIARKRGGLRRYVFEFVAFQAAATVHAALLHLRRRYAVVQVNSLPDWLVFAAIVPRLLGARVLLDLHECMPEYASTKYGLSLRHPVVRILEWVEQASIRFANGVITCTDQMKELFVDRGAPADKMGVVLNSFDEDRLQPERYRASPPADGLFTLVCHGTLDPNFGVDLAIRAVALLADRIPELRLRIYGDGPQRPELVALVARLGIEDRVWLSDGFIPITDLLPRIVAADAGVVAIRRDAFRDRTHCNKMYDLIAMRRPVIISRTRAVEEYFGDACFAMFRSGDAEDLARAIALVHANPELRLRLVERATAVSEPYRWAHQRERYLGAVRRLVPRAAEAEQPRPSVVATAEEH